MTTPLVTIITVTYNLLKNGRKETFISTIESVQDQTYKNIEHIIIDGASNDGSIELIKEYTEKGFIKYISECDKNIYDAMNKGGKIANGKYILFLNSDDSLSEKSGIEKSVNALEKGNYDFSYAKAKIIDEKGNRVLSHSHNNPDISKVFTEMPFCHQTLLTKTEIFRQLGMFDIDFKSAADYDFVQKLILKKYRSIFIPLEMVKYRIGGYSNMDKSTSIDETVQIYFNNYSRFHEISIEECRDIFSSKNIPISLLIKLILNTNLGIKNNIKLILKYSRKKVIRVRLSLKNPSIEIFGIKFV